MRSVARLPTLAIAILSLSLVVSCSDTDDPTAAPRPSGRSLSSSASPVESSRAVETSQVAESSEASAPGQPVAPEQSVRTEPESAKPSTADPNTSRPPTEATPLTPSTEDLGAPARVSVSKIGVNVPLFHLRVDKQGRLEAPKDPNDAGWWQHKGSTVIVGHVDSQSGPAIFYRVRELRPGDSVIVNYANGQTKKFIADDVRQVNKNAFPTDDVYRAGPGKLRLVTCGGAFDRKSGHYKDNVIVFATETYD